MGNVKLLSIGTPNNPFSVPDTSGNRKTDKEYPRIIPMVLPMLAIINNSIIRLKFISSFETPIDESRLINFRLCSIAKLIAE